MDCTIPMDKILIMLLFTIFRVDLNFAGHIGYNSSYLSSSPIGVCKPLVKQILGMKGSKSFNSSHFWI